MKRLFACSMLAAAFVLTAMAADINGKWTGTLTPENGDSQPALLVLKQDGTAVTGTAGPNEDQQWQIRMGKIEDNKVTMEVQGDNDRLFRLELVLDGDHLKGDLTGTHEGETIKGKLDVSRVK